MEDYVYKQYVDVLDTHWWTRSRRRLLTSLLAQVGVRPDGRHQVLEIGSGAGTELPFLHRYGPVTGIELSEVGLKYCAERGYDVLERADLNDYVPEPASFDLLVDLHVLYHKHVADPAAVLRKLGTGLKPGGWLVMTEPAYQWLSRDHDRAVMMGRRWSGRGLRQLVASAGLTIERHTGFMTLLLPVVVAGKLLERVRTRPHDHVAELTAPSPLVDKSLSLVMGVERAVSLAVPLPVGTSWALIARRPS